MAKIHRFDDFIGANTQSNEGVDKYDDMDKQFPIVDKTMKKVADFLTKNGYKISEVSEPDYDVDGSITIDPKISVTVGLDNSFYVTYEMKDSNFMMSSDTKNLDTLLKDIQKMEKLKKDGK